MSTASKRAAWAAFLALTLAINFITVAAGLASGGMLRTIQILALIILIAAFIFISFAGIGLKMADWGEPESEEEFDRIIERSEELARSGQIYPPTEAELLNPLDDNDFERIVAIALDQLPDQFQQALSSNVAVLISDDGASHRAYGLYQGGTVSRDITSDKIIIFRDTLRRDFGQDPRMLVEQIIRVVRHEVAHHIGFDEPGVARLGL